MASYRASLQLFRRYSTEELHRTPLYDLHLGYGAKMVPFAGFSMPVQYADTSLAASHTWTRKHAGLFDVSHMVQHRFSGPGATQFFERVTPTEISALKPWTSTLSVLMNDNGGIVDDTVISRHGENEYYIVTNAACRSKDVAYLRKHLAEFDVHHELLDGWGLLALQGPLAAQILQAHTPTDLSTLKFGQSAFCKVDGREVHVARGGYTGEDGFEISVPPAEAADFAQALLASQEVRPVGLGARDSLRLEAGMCLYGNDLDDTTTPIEANLAWVVSKSRREQGGFIGDAKVLEQLKNGAPRRRVGFLVQGAPARQGAEILDAEGKGVVGTVTSGCPSPTLGKNIAMGYIQTGLHKSGTEVAVRVRGKTRAAQVTKMPFVKTNYYR